MLSRQHARETAGSFPATAIAVSPFNDSSRDASSAFGTTTTFTLIGSFCKRTVHYSKLQLANKQIESYHYYICYLMSNFFRRGESMVALEEQALEKNSNCACL